MKLTETKIPVALVLLSATLYLLLKPTYISASDYKNNLSNKVVLVCDASSGLGEQLAYELAKQGARLMLITRTGRSETLLYVLKDGKLASPQAQSQISAQTFGKLRKVGEEAVRLGSPQVELMSWDFGNVTGSHTVVDQTVALLGGLDYLVLNQAELPRGDFLQFKDRHTPHFIDRSFSVNVFSMIEIAQKAMPHLEQSRGHIFITSSLLGEIPKAGMSVFSGTKHALNGFFYSLQRELKSMKSPVTVTLGSLGEIAPAVKMPVFKLPAWMVGDITECAHKMVDSFITRPKTFTYPKLHPFLARFSWTFLTN